ncbi:RNB domain-containing ribonuclease [Geminocystis sp. NIES-3709]|uniref:RNB domain-containing ribonuclease n=1 Tax=Geminocystis sp. NIES-3709 TaxID=1617448 RepID=UPI0005FC65AE|nr:RNB domain-containing ribonuclease [Geminocystis sp. NIES-3709]BAQ63307.1 3'-to-5' exoribonuclease RNase R [Geminocystis sp. NIES-3709]
MIKPRKFASAQIKQASAINLADYYSNRLPVFGITIDDDTTVDRDDGIWLVELNNGNFELQVSITDVSTITPKNSSIDEEALLRVITLYHTSPPTPMLPSHISTNLGSLEEEERRLALTIFFQIDSSGNVNSFRIKETIFTNKNAFSYEEVEKILMNPQDIAEHKLLVKMQKVAQLIGKKRGGNSGILTVDGYLDEDGNLIQENVNTYQLIAELMILTNTTIANFLAENNVSALYRTQDVGTTDFETVKKTMGHCLVPANYHPWAKPHVGLGLMAYTHFTSPLRRYVDLVNHRIVKAILRQESSPYTISELENLCTHINNFNQQLKIDRNNYIKQKKQEDIERKFNNIDKLNIEKLSGDEFSDLLQYAVFNNVIDKIFPYIEFRLDKLQPKDFYFLWFIAKINKFFDFENVNSPSILLIKTQLDSSVIEYKSQYSTVNKNYYVHCYIDGLTTENPAEDIKKNKAKQKAALAVIKGYVCDELISNPSPIEGLSLVDEENPLESDLSSLNDKDFSKILDYCIKTNFDEKTIEEITNRINNLLPKDLYKIWFQGKINRFFDKENLDTISVLLIHSQLTTCQVEYKIDYLSQSKKYVAYCYVDNLTHPQPQVDTKKTKAKQKASLAYIESYLNEKLTDQPDLYIEEEEKIDYDILTENSIQSNLVENQEKNIIEDNDWVSKLHSFCQLNHLEFPEYEFRNIDSFFTCKIKINYGDKTLISHGYGRSKKDAKKSASYILVIQHNLNLSKLVI